MISDKFDRIPGRVQAALQYIQHTNAWVTDPFVFFEFQPKGRTLDPSELAAYRAALETVRLYFAGEMDFGGVPPNISAGSKENRECKKCRKLAGQ